MIKRILQQLRMMAVGVVMFTSLAYLAGCSIDVITDEYSDSGLSSGIHQIANGVIDIIDYFD